MKLLPAVVSLLALAHGSGETAETRSIRTDIVTVPARPRLQSADSASRTNRTDHFLAQSGAWRYEKTVDKTGRTVYKASVTSANLVKFEYPYQGGSSATLTIRTGNDGTYVSIEVAKGQFNRSFQGGSARIHFDGKPPITYSLTAAANGRANIVFFNADRKLIDQIKAAGTMLIQVTFDGQAVRKILFKTAGLRWSHG